MSVAASVGSRLPAFHTAMGRVQLGFLDEAEIGAGSNRCASSR